MRQAPTRRAVTPWLQVSGDIEVKGQIKLQCKTVTGKPFVVVRSFQLTQKKGGKYEFKALDQTISTVNEHGKVWLLALLHTRRASLWRSRVAARQREALSKKCADINLEVPALMGVSKVWHNRALLKPHPAHDSSRLHCRQSWRTSSSCTKTTPTGAPHWPLGFVSGMHVELAAPASCAQAAG